MALKTVPKITKKQITENGVQKLADRPNLSGQYGASGLSAAQLKLWFDKLATLLAERINEIVDTISSEDAANYIRVCLDEYSVGDFGELITSFTNGNFAEKILQLFPSAGANEKQSLQTIINDIAINIAGLKEELYYNRQAIKKFTLSALIPTKYYNKDDIVVCNNKQGGKQFYIALEDGVPNTDYPYNRPSQWKIYKPQFAENAKIAELDSHGNNIGETFLDIKNKISDIISMAPEKFDTLKEIADYLENHGAEAADLIDAVRALEEKTKNVADEVASKEDIAILPFEWSGGDPDIKVVNYKKGDTIVYNGLIYIARKDTNSNNEPYPGDTEYWEHKTVPVEVDSVDYAFNALQASFAEEAQKAIGDEFGDSIPEKYATKEQVESGEVLPPIATNTSKGVMSGNSNAAFILQDGKPQARPLTPGEYSKAAVTAFVAKGTLEANKSTYVKEGITTNTETLTAQEKEDACEWLGAADKKYVDDYAKWKLLGETEITQEMIDEAGEEGITAVLIDLGTPIEKWYGETWVRMESPKSDLNTENIAVRCVFGKTETSAVGYPEDCPIWLSQSASYSPLFYEYRNCMNIFTNWYDDMACGSHAQVMVYGSSEYPMYAYGNTNSSGKSIIGCQYLAFYGTNKKFKFPVGTKLKLYGRF